MAATWPSCCWTRRASCRASAMRCASAASCKAKWPWPRPSPAADPRLARPRKSPILDRAFFRPAPARRTRGREHPRSIPAAFGRPVYSRLSRDRPFRPQRLRVVHRRRQAFQHRLGVERADRHRGIGGDAALGLQQLVAQAAHAQEGGEIGGLAAVLHQFVVKALDQLRDPHAVARRDLFQHLPEQLFQPQAGGRPMQAQGAGFRRVGLFARADEDFTHGRSWCGHDTCEPLYDDTRRHGKTPLPAGGPRRFCNDKFPCRPHPDTVDINQGLGRVPIRAC